MFTHTKLSTKILESIYLEVLTKTGVRKKIQRCIIARKTKNEKRIANLI